MAVRLRFAPEVEGDLDEAYAWYEIQREGLGEEFLTCVDNCLDTIRRHPEIHPLAYRSYRRGLLRRFPFAVFYEYLEGEVTVYSVFHTHRDPDRWRKRLSKR